MKTYLVEIEDADGGDSLREVRARSEEEAARLAARMHSTELGSAPCIRFEIVVVPAVVVL